MASRISRCKCTAKRITSGRTSSPCGIGVSLRDGGPVQVSIPWPDKGLSPNARLHRLEVARLKRAARMSAYYIARGVVPAGKRWPSALHLTIEFRPPDDRRRDLDNMLASCKACLDGLSDALGVDDSQWTLTLSRGPKIKGGAVNITIKET